MKVYKNFINFDKEEAWLSEMARKGNFFIYKSSLGGYDFNYIPNRSGEYTYKIDYRTFRKEEDYRNYRAMFEDSGWHHISGSKWSGSQYFVKIRPDAGDDIFSDNLSKAGRYKRISTLWLYFVIIYTFTLVVLCLNNNFLPSPNGIYLTPGLWEMKGWHFISAFLFETPFAVMRISGLFIYLFLIIYYLRYAIKSYTLYKKTLQQK